MRAAGRPGFFVQGHRALLEQRAAAWFGKDHFPADRRRAVLQNQISGLKNAFRWPFAVRQLKPHLRGIRGCNLAIWRDDLLRVNGYNEDFAGWGREDSELAARLFNAGIAAARSARARLVLPSLASAGQPGQTRRQRQPAGTDHPGKNRALRTWLGRAFAGLMENILLIRLKSIGDVIFTLPAVGRAAGTFSRGQNHLSHLARKRLVAARVPASQRDHPPRPRRAAERPSAESGRGVFRTVAPSARGKVFAGGGFSGLWGNGVAGAAHRRAAAMGHRLWHGPPLGLHPWPGAQ